MKTSTSVGPGAAPIVRLLDDDDEARSPAGSGQAGRARAFTAPLVEGRTLSSGEGVLEHADGAAAILAGIGAAPALCAAAWLVHAADQLGKPDEVLTPLFGASQTALVRHARKLGELQRAAQGARGEAAPRAGQIEGVRKMLLAFSRDLRVVLLRLASRLQTLRFHAASKRPCPHSLASETMQLFVPLANRLGIWQLKWELEDLCFRFLDPDAYRVVAGRIDERRADRERRVEALRTALADDLAAHGLQAEVQGRPKHLHSIWKKMRSKGLDFAQVLDVVALRVIVVDVAGCYAVLGRVHERYAVVAGELDDYIARPKANGYRSLHTVVRDNDGGAIEIQIRTPEMHEHAEYGVAAHWAYKEGPSAPAASGAGFEARVAQARLVVLRQLLAWERDLSSDDAAAGGPGNEPERGVFDDRIYVFTPQAEVVELAAGATPIDFAYAVHTDLGHRCRGARVDGAIVPLNTPLASGQTVEVNAAKTGGPSLDWLNGELGYLQSPRSRAKVRAWFNALAQAATVARGREAVEKLLQREGRTALKHVDLATQLGFRSADALFEVVGKDEISLRSIEALLRPPVDKPEEAEVILKRPRTGASAGGTGGVLVVGVESLLTTLARCCRPAPPDAIRGYVTRGKGVAVHRASCSNLRELTGRSPERLIPVAWGAADTGRPLMYPVDVSIEASDRPGLLRDVSEVFAKEKMNVTGVKSQSVPGVGGSSAFMTFTIEVAGTARVASALADVVRVPGVRSARRK